jgi:hypothetical protein
MLLQLSSECRPLNRVATCSCSVGWSASPPLTKESEGGKLSFALRGSLRTRKDCGLALAPPASSKPAATRRSRGKSRLASVASLARALPLFPRIRAAAAVAAADRSCCCSSFSARFRQPEAPSSSCGSLARLRLLPSRLR